MHRNPLEIKAPRYRRTLDPAYIPVLPSLKELPMTLRINSEAPNFTAETTEGKINFHDWIGNGHAILDQRRRAGFRLGTGV